MAVAYHEPMLPVPHRVRRMTWETDDTFTMELVAAGGGGITSFAPGQFNMLYVFGVGEAAISMSGSPSNPETLLHTTRAVGSVTKALASLHPGQLIGVRGPYGVSWPVDEAEGRDIVIITGGIGLAPLRPLIYTLIEQRERFGNITILFGARTPDEILFRDEIEQWRRRFDMDVLITVDRASRDWRGRLGVVTTLIPQSPFDPKNSIAYVCGPEVMMYFTLEALEKRGMPRERVFVSMERNMKCGLGFCGHCQLGPKFVCKDGPVFRWTEVASLLDIREI